MRRNSNDYSSHFTACGDRRSVSPGSLKTARKYSPKERAFHDNASDAVSPDAPRGGERGTVLQISECSAAREPLGKRRSKSKGASGSGRLLWDPQAPSASKGPLSADIPLHNKPYERAMRYDDRMLLGIDPIPNHFDRKYYIISFHRKSY